MAKRKKFDTPGDLIQYYCDIKPFSYYKLAEKDIRIQAKEITTELIKHFGNKYDIIEVIALSTHKPPFSVEWEIKEKK